MFALIAWYYNIHTHIKIKSFAFQTLIHQFYIPKKPNIDQNTCMYKTNWWNFYSSRSTRFLPNLHFKRLLSLNTKMRCAFNAMCFLFTNLIAYDAVLQMVKISLSIANATSNGAIINEMYYLFRIFNSVQLIDQ